MDRLTPEGRAEAQAAIRSLKPERDRATCEAEWGQPSAERGRVAWTFTGVFVAGELRYVLCSGRDDAPRRRSEQALRESEARLRGIVKTAVDPIVVIDSRGVIELFNPAAERLFGYDAEEVIGQNCSLLMPAPYAEEHDGYIEQYLRTGRKRIIGIGREVTGRRRDGSIFPLELSVSEVRTATRVIFTGVLRDLSERKLLEHEILTISEAEQRRIGQDLHDSLGQQLTGLAFLIGALQQKLIARALPEAADADRIAEQVERAIDHTRRLSRGLSPVDLSDGELQGALSSLAHDVRELAGIECRADADPLALDPVTATHIYRIAQEAVNNAVKHAAPSCIEIDLTQHDDWATLTVSDNGIGLPPRVDPQRGAGLRNMQRRAQMIGGQVTLGPGARRGAVVRCRFRLPLRALRD
jgi:PAS domain S-box-containing protein